MKKSEYWRAIDVLQPKHKMASGWHEMYKHQRAYCSDQSPNGWGNFGCERCNLIVNIQKTRNVTIFPRNPIK